MSLGQIIRQRRKQLGLTQDQVATRADISKPYLSNIETGKCKNPPTDGVLESLERVLGFESSELIGPAHLDRTPPDVRHEHEMLHAQVQKLRGMLQKFIDEGPRNQAGGVDLNALAKQLESESNVTAVSAGAPVPVINKVAAGYPHNFTDLDYPPSIADEYVRCPDVHDPQAFATRVVGDSMEPDYHEGDIVVFCPNSPPRSGDDCFVRFGSDATTTFKRFYQDDENTVRLQPLNNKYPAETYPVEAITGLWPAGFRIDRLNSP